MPKSGFSDVSYIILPNRNIAISQADHAAVLVVSQHDRRGPSSFTLRVYCTQPITLSHLPTQVRQALGNP